MAHIASKMMWVRSLIHEMWIMTRIHMNMKCEINQQFSIPINLIFHERTKYIEMDCHFIRDLVIKKQIVTLYVWSED